MPEHVRTDLLIDPSRLSCFPDDLPEAIAGHCCPSVGAEEEWTWFALEEYWSAAVDALRRMVESVPVYSFGWTPAIPPWVAIREAIDRPPAD